MGNVRLQNWLSCTQLGRPPEATVRRVQPQSPGDTAVSDADEARGAASTGDSSHRNLTSGAPTSVSTELLPRVYIACHPWATPLACAVRDVLRKEGFEVEYDPTKAHAADEATRITYYEDSIDWAASKRVGAAELPATASGGRGGTSTNTPRTVGGKCIVLLTPAATTRPHGYCRTQLNRALSKGLDFVPLMVRFCEVPLSICRIQWLDFRRTLSDDGSILQERFATQVPQLKVCFCSSPFFMSRSLGDISANEDVVVK